MKKTTARPKGAEKNWKPLTAGMANAIKVEALCGARPCTREIIERNTNKNEEKQA